MKFLKMILFFFLCAAFPLTFVFNGFSSDSIEIVNQAKKNGIIGEKPDGYLGMIDINTPQKIQSAMEEINIKRKSVYMDLAKQQKVSLDVVSALTGEKLISNLPAGHYYYNVQLQKWVKK